MNRIISENPEIIREEIPREEAEQLFAHEPLKLELLAGIPQTDTISIYRQSEFIDLCRGPHLASAGQIKAFSLTHVSGAYWRGDSNQKCSSASMGKHFPQKRS